MQSLIFDAQATEVFDKNNSLRLDRQEPRTRNGQHQLLNDVYS